MVAPRVGAWIETLCPLGTGKIPVSHPVWVRGLKHQGQGRGNDDQSRTPCGCVD